MKAIRWLAPILALAVVACGDGDSSIQSPDFTPELVGLALSPDTATIAVGDSVVLTTTGTFTQEPGSEPPTEEAPATASWSVDNEELASISVDGSEATVTGLAQGQVEVVAELDGLEVSAIVTIEAPLLQGIVIEPDPVTVPLGAEQIVRVLGVYSDDGEPRELADGTIVAWTVPDPTVATVSPLTGVETTVSGQGLGDTTLTATTTNGDGEVLSSTADISVTDAVLTAVASVEPEEASIAVGLTQEFAATGMYSDGTTALIPDEDVDWSSSDEAVATIDADGVATGVGAGEATITATLGPAVMPEIEGDGRSATATLTVSTDACLSRMLASNGATVEVETGPTNLQCLGCIVDDEFYIIDDDLENYAKMIVPVGLLGGFVNVTVTAAGDENFEAGSQPGFLIARPANALLSAELLSQLTVSTLLDGIEQESTSETALLRLTLLGQLGDDTLALATLDAPATTEYDAVRLNFASTLVTALSSVDVYAACTSTELAGE